MIPSPNCHSIQPLKSSCTVLYCMQCRGYTSTGKYNSLLSNPEDDYYQTPSKAKYCGDRDRPGIEDAQEQEQNAIRMYPWFQNKMQLSSSRCHGVECGGRVLQDGVEDVYMFLDDQEGPTDSPPDQAEFPTSVITVLTWHYSPSFTDTTMLLFFLSASAKGGCNLLPSVC
jgi:hypothetical protein